MSIVVSTPIIINTTSALSQVDISDFFTRYVIVGFGAQVEQGSVIESAWNTSTHTLDAFIDSGSYKDKNAEDIDMFFNMDSSGDILSLSLKATFEGGVKITGEFVPADINSTRQQVLKQAYQAFDALEAISNASTNDEVMLAVLDALGYSQVVNLTSSWDSENLTATIGFDDARLNNASINAQQIVVSTDSSGNIDSYSNTYSQSGLNDVQEFAYKIGNYAMTDIYNVEQVANAANHTSKLTNNISFDLYKEGSDTTQDLVINNGKLSINENYSFDTIKVTNTDHYASDITISDAIAVLRDIVDLDNLTGGAFHAADVNNDGVVTISDAIAVLRDIVDLDTIDTFDLVDESNNRVSDIDATTLDTTPEWLMVANGDVNASGNFAESFVVSSDLV